MLSRRVSKLLPYQPKQLYELVADVERYPQFLPWCLAVEVTARNPKGFSARVTVGNRVMAEEFTSHDVLKPPTAADPNWRIEVRSDEPPFKRLENRWVFAPHPEGSEVDFMIEMDFQSSLRGRLFKAIFTKAVDKMINAFEERARHLYG